MMCARDIFSKLGSYTALMDVSEMYWCHSSCHSLHIVTLRRVWLANLVLTSHWSEWQTGKLLGKCRARFKTVGPLGRIYLGMKCELPNAFFSGGRGGVAMKRHLVGAFLWWGVAKLHSVGALFWSGGGGGDSEAPFGGAIFGGGPWACAQSALP